GAACSAARAVGGDILRSASRAGPSDAGSGTTAPEALGPSGGSTRNDNSGVHAIQNGNSSIASSTTVQTRWRMAGARTRNNGRIASAAAAINAARSAASAKTSNMLRLLPAVTPHVLLEALD